MAVLLLIIYSADIPSVHMTCTYVKVWAAYSAKGLVLGHS